MPVSLFETRSMLAMLEQMLPVRTFLLDLFFQDTEVSMTEAVDIDIYKGKRRMAPFVNPKQEGKVIERLGFKTLTFTPPYLKPKWVTDAADILNRQPGEHIYTPGMSPAARAADQLMRDLREADEMITRREEWMAAQALNGGVISVSGEGVEADIDFQMNATHKVTLVGTDLWTDTVNSTPLEDLRTWKRTIAQSSGLQANAAVFGASVIDAFLAHPDVKDQLNTRRIDLGQINPTFLSEQGATYYGQIKGAGLNLDIYGYDEWYVDDAGNEQPMVPVDRIFLGATGARTARHYGAIRDLKATAPVRMFPKSWEQKDPSGQVVLVQSAPIVVPHQVDAFMTIKAV